MGAVISTGLKSTSAFGAALTSEPEDDTLFLMFKDATSGTETYGAGRFLYSSSAVDESGTTILDFNLAYNPPCAFTAFATCALPPPQNYLPIVIKAGEKIP